MFAVTRLFSHIRSFYRTSCPWCCARSKNLVIFVLLVTSASFPSRDLAVALVIAAFNSSLFGAKLCVLDLPVGNGRLLSCTFDSSRSFLWFYVLICLYCSALCANNLQGWPCSLGLSGDSPWNFSWGGKPDKVFWKLFGVFTERKTKQNIAKTTLVPGGFHCCFLPTKYQCFFEPVIYSYSAGRCPSLLPTLCVHSTWGGTRWEPYLWYRGWVDAQYGLGNLADIVLLGWCCYRSWFGVWGSIVTGSCSFAENIWVHGYWLQYIWTATI